MSQARVPQIVTNGTLYIPTDRPRGLLARWFGETAVIVRQTPEEQAIDRIQSEGNITRAAMAEEAKSKLFASQLMNMIEQEEDRMKKETGKKKVLNTIGVDFDFNAKVEDFLSALEALGLDPLQEVQHKLRVQQTVRRSRKHRRRH